MKTLITFLILATAVLAAPTRPKDATPAAAPASDDKLLLDGTTNGTRALSALYYQPAATGTPDGTKFLRDDNSWQAILTGVSSVFGRTGAVTAQSGDYSAYYLPLSGGTMAGPITWTVDPMTATTVFDITKPWSSKSISGNVTWTPSAAGSANTVHVLVITNSDTAAHTVTIDNTGTDYVLTVAPGTAYRTLVSNATDWVPTSIDPAAGTVATGSVIYGRNATTGADETYTRASIAALTETLTNKRVSARVTSITSSATPTVNTDNCDCVTITALAAAITSMTTNLTGTPSPFDQLEFRIKDDGTARAITWGASFVSGNATLPTTTVVSKALHVWLEWDSGQSKWVCVGTGSDA